MTGAASAVRFGKLSGGVSPSSQRLPRRTSWALRQSEHQKVKDAESLVNCPLDMTACVAFTAPDFGQLARTFGI
jgi:hypothetical protein